MFDDPKDHPIQQLAEITNGQRSSSIELLKHDRGLRHTHFKNGKIKANFDTKYIAKRERQLESSNF